MAALSSIAFVYPVRNPAPKWSRLYMPTSTYFDVSLMNVTIELQASGLLVPVPYIPITGTGSGAGDPVITGLDNVIDWRT